MVGRGPDDIVNMCEPLVIHAATKTKDPRLVMNVSGEQHRCTGFENLARQFAAIRVPRCPRAVFSKHALALVCCVIFRGLFRNDDAWKAFSEEITTDIVGVIKRTGPSSKGSSVSKTSLSPIELVCKWCL